MDLKKHKLKFNNNKEIKKSLSKIANLVVNGELKHYDASLNGKTEGLPEKTNAGTSEEAKTAAPEPEYAAGAACNLDGTGC